MTTSDSAARAMIPEPTRTGLAADTLQRAVLDNLAYLQARYPDIATPHDWYMALARRAA
jgi:glycogen phosphorylase